MVQTYLVLVDTVIAELLTAAGECAGFEPFCRRALGQLRELAPCDAALILPRSPAERPVVVDKKLEMLEVYRANEARYNRELERAHAVGARDGAYVDTELYGAGERARLGFFNEILRPQRIKTRLVAQLSFRGRPLATVQLLRHGRASDFDDRSLGMVRRVVPALALAYAALRPGGQASRLDGLSARERQIVEQVCAGRQNKEIARALALSPNTVRNQLAQIFRKLGVATRAELTARALTI